MCARAVNRWRFATTQSQNDTRPDLVALELSCCEAPAIYGARTHARMSSILPPAAEITGQTDGFHFGIKRKTLAIRQVDGNHLIALLELLSFSNKASPDQLQKLVSKCTDALENDVHVSIVDPYPPNRHAPCGIHGRIWSELGEAAPAWPESKPYTTVSYAAAGEIQAYAQPYGLGDLIPDLPLFLKPDFHVSVPLEKTYMEAFRTLPAHLREKLESPVKRYRKKSA